MSHSFLWQKKKKKKTEDTLFSLHREERTQKAAKVTHPRDVNMNEYTKALFKTTKDGSDFNFDDMAVLVFRSCHV